MRSCVGIRKSAFSLHPDLRYAIFNECPDKKNHPSLNSNNSCLLNPFYWIKYRCKRPVMHLNYKVPTFDIPRKILVPNIIARDYFSEVKYLCPSSFGSLGAKTIDLSTLFKYKGINLPLLHKSRPQLGDKYEVVSQNGPKKMSFYCSLFS